MGQYDGSIRINTDINKKPLSKGIKGIGASMKKLAGVIGVAFSVRALINFGKESKNLYKIQETQETKLATVMRQRMNATDDMIQSVKELTGAQQELGIIGDEVQLAGAQQLATFLSTDKALKQLIPSMNNLIAQQYGFDATAESARNLASLMGRAIGQGTLSRLARMGINVTDVQEKAFKMANEFERSRMLAEIITGNVGDMNRALAQTDLGRQQQLANTWGDVKEVFGEALTRFGVLFIPMLQKAVKLMENLANLFVFVADVMSDIMGQGYDDVAESGQKVVDVQHDIAEALEETTEAVDGSVAGFDKLNTLSDAMQPDEDTDIGIGGFSAEVGKGTKISPEMQGVFARIKDEMLPVLDEFMEYIRNLGEIFSFVWESYIKPFAEAIIENLLPVFENLAKSVLDFYNEALLPICEWILEELKPVFDVLFEYFIEAITQIINFLGGFIDFLTGVFTGDWSKAWEGIKTMAEAIWKGTINAWTTLWDTMSFVLKGAINGISSFLQVFVNGIISAINLAIRALNKLSFTVPNWVPAIGGRSWGFNIPELSKIEIPKLAQGAVIPPNQEFLAILGDQKSGTNIETPLDTMLQAFRMALSEHKRHSDNQPLNVTLELDGRQLARAVVPSLKTAERGRGVSLVIGETR